MLSDTRHPILYHVIGFIQRDCAENNNLVVVEQIMASDNNITY